MILSKHPTGALRVAALLILLGCTSLTLGGAALKAVPWAAGTTPPWSGEARTPIGYHPVESGSFGEGWVTLINQEDGGYILFLATLFHVGPIRYSQGLAAFAYLPSGERLFASASQRGEESFAGSNEPLALRMGGSSWGGAYPQYHLTLDLDRAKGRINFEDARPALVPGTGQVSLGDEGTFGLTHLTPWAKARGTLHFGEREVEIRGDAYQENLYGVAIPPDFSTRWDLLRYFGPDYALSIVQIGLQDDLGGGAIRSLILTPKEGPALITDAFELVPLGPLADADPMASRQGGRFEIKTLPQSPFALKGEVRVGREVERLDIMGELPLFVRLLAGTLYGRPVHHRYVGEVDLRLGEGEGAVKLEGRGFGEAHIYEP